MKKITFILFFLLPFLGFSQWIKVKSGTTKNLMSVCFPTKTTGYTVGGDITSYVSGVILKTSDAGTTWTTLTTDSTNFYTSVFFPDSLTGFVTGFDSNFLGIILKTLNGGLTWNPVYIGNANKLLAVYFTGTNTGYTAGQSGTILKTTNGGNLWSVQASGTSLDLHSVYFRNADTGYIVGGIEPHPYMSTVGVILMTVNGGAVWTGSGNEYAPDYNSVYFTDANTGYAAGIYSRYYGGGIYDNESAIGETINGGTSWGWGNVSNESTTTTLNSVYFTDINKGYLAGGSGTIYKTADGGLYWASQVSGTSSDLYSIYFTEDSTGYVVGDNGTILKTTDGGGYPVGTNDMPTRPGTLKIYPTPSTIQITIEIPKLIPGWLSILNPAGQQFISRQVSEVKTIIDISNLSNGVYFVRLTNDKTTEVAKFIKQ
jgi:photosystem II stability/assembly factor-like uncharacterized protein